MIIGLIACAAGLAAMLALIVRMAIFALPAFVAMTAGRLAYETGAGLPGAIFVGAIAGIALFLGARGLLGAVRSPMARIALAAAFAVPSAYAGYFAALGLSSLGGAEGLWRPIFAAAGALMIGVTAVVKLLAPANVDDVVIGAPFRERLSSGGARS